MIEARLFNRVEMMMSAAEREYELDLFKIEEVVMTAKIALEKGVLDEGFDEGIRRIARENPDDFVYVYRYEGREIGAVYSERASLQTLKDFAAYFVDVTSDEAARNQFAAEQKAMLERMKKSS